MRYVPQKKAEIMYNSYSGRKNNVFQKKKRFFLKILIFYRRVPPLDIFDDVRYFSQKKFFLKNDSSET